MTLLVLVNETMETTNPYQSPAAPDGVAVPCAPVVYRSRRAAAIAGAWLGAKFGGKWMAIILGILGVLLWVFVLVTFLYRWLRSEGEFGVVVEEFNRAVHPIELLGMTLLAIAMSTFYTAVICGLISGVAGAISYRKVTSEGDNSNQPKGPAAAERPG